LGNKVISHLQPQSPCKRTPTVHKTQFLNSKLPVVTMYFEYWLFPCWVHLAKGSGEGIILFAGNCGLNIIPHTYHFLVLKRGFVHLINILSSPLISHAQ